MPIDTSFYPTQQPAPQNPLSLVQGYASAAHALGENKLQQQTIRGRMALGNIISSSMNSDGTPNPPEILRKASQNPDAAWMVLQLQDEAKNANPLTSYMGTNKAGQPTPAQAPLYQVAGQNNPDWKSQPDMSQDKIDQLHAHNQGIINTLEPLANDPDINHKKVIRGVADLVAHPDVDFNATDGATALTKIPFGPNGAPPSSQDIHQVLKPIVDQQKQHEQILRERYPSSQHLAARTAAASLSNPTQPEATQPSPIDLASPGTATGVPTGYSNNQSNYQTHYHDVVSAADSVPTENAALDNVLDLSKSGAPSGTVLGTFYSYLAAHNIAPPGAETGAEQLKLIQAHASQLALAAGMPGSDERLHALQTAKISDADLPKVIQTMIPYLKAVNNSKIAQAKFYQKSDPTGSDPQKIASARATWQQNIDPRVFELQELQHEPEELQGFLKGLSKSDRTELFKKYKSLKGLGILDE